ncbi:hypothetical protein ACFV03_19810 [Streptomyces mirabilis]|uniref:hypothetical protein n=1 Tax=Streptomyces mirabilis TaxID=68239 RepID=UPI00369D9F68
MIAGEECPNHRAKVTTGSPASGMIEAQVCRSTWKTSFGAAAHCRGFAPSARG